MNLIDYLPVIENFIAVNYKIILIVLLILLLYINFKRYMTIKKLNDLKQALGQMEAGTQYNFELDSNFLLYIIGYKCKIYTSKILEPQSMISKDKLLKGDILDKIVSSIVYDIYVTMSPRYKNLISKYFTDISLKKYISEVVMETMLTIGKNLNSRKIKNIYNLNKGIDSAVIRAAGKELQEYSNNKKKQERDIPEEKEKK